MNFTIESAALMGAIGIITLSLFTTQIVKYFVGVGTFGVFFLLFFVASGSPDLSIFIAMSLSIFMASIYDWILKNDIYSAVLLIAIATTGFLILAIMLSTLWYCYKWNVNSYTGSNLFQFHNQFINNYKEIFQLLK